MRAFIGVRADAATVAAVARCRQAFPVPLHWVAGDNLHLTLSFLGEIDEACVPALARVLAPVAAACPSFSLCWSAWAWFPSETHARVLAWLPAPNPVLMAWQQALESVLREAGFLPENRPYRPHLSLARVRRAECSLPPDGTGVPVAMPVTALSLFRSDSTPAGVRYSACFSLPLGESASSG